MWAPGQVRYFAFHFHDANNTTYVSQQSELFLLDSLRDKEGQCSIISRTSKHQACYRNPTTGPCNRCCHSWSGFETFDDNTICYCKDTAQDIIYTIHNNVGSVFQNSHDICVRTKPTDIPTCNHFFFLSVEQHHKSKFCRCH